MTQGHPEGKPLPLHPSSKRSVRTADDFIATQEEARPDGIGEGRNVCGPAFEAGQGVLVDRQGVQLRPQPMGLLFPLGHRSKLGGKMRFPERDVTDPANAENRRQLGSCSPHFADFFGVRWQ